MISYLLEASVCLTVFYMFYHFFLRADKHFALNRGYLLISSAIACFIPAIEFAVPSTRELALSHSFIQNAAVTFTANQEKFTTVESFNFNTYWLLYACYFAGIFFLFSLLFKDLLAVRKLIAHHKAEKIENYKLIRIRSSDSVFSFYHYIFWGTSQELSEAETNQLIQHELAHVRQKHSFDLLYMELLKIIFWFNPIVYLYRKALTEQHEFLADQAVVTQTNAESYSQLLVKNLFQKLEINVSNSFSQINIKKRIAMINKANSPRKTLLKLFGLLPVTLSLLLAFSFQGWAQLSIAPYDLKKMNLQTLYLNCGNPVSLDMSGTKSNGGVTYKIIGGDLLMGEKENDVIIIPTAAKVSIDAFQDNVKVKSFEFGVRKIPIPQIQPVVFNHNIAEKNITTQNLSNLNITVSPDANLRKFLPDDANYYPKGTVSLIRDNKTVMSTQLNVGFDHAGFEMAEAGDKVKIEIDQIYRVNFRGQLEEISANEKEFELMVVASE